MQPIPVRDKPLIDEKRTLEVPNHAQHRAEASNRFDREGVINTQYIFAIRQKESVVASCLPRSTRSPLPVGHQTPGVQRSWAVVPMMQ